jgi:hypothetical protein
LDVDESKTECQQDMDICYGFLTMISANFTKQIGTDNNTVSVYEVRVEKGCGKKSEFMSNVKKGNRLKVKIALCILVNIKQFNSFSV